jgi:hypothetical protein
VRLVSTGDPEHDMFDEYAHRFRVLIPAAWVRTVDNERQIRGAINLEKPAHTQFDLYLVEAGLSIGTKSTIGLDTIIGDYPRIRLASIEEEGGRPSFLPASPRLGYDTILAEATKPMAGVVLSSGVYTGINAVLN